MQRSMMIFIMRVVLTTLTRLSSLTFPECICWWVIPRFWNEINSGTGHWSLDGIGSFHSPLQSLILGVEKRRMTPMHGRCIARLTFLGRQRLFVIRWTFWQNILRWIINDISSRLHKNSSIWRICYLNLFVSFSDLQDEFKEWHKTN